MQSELLHCLSAKEWEALIGSIINKILDKRSLQQVKKERLLTDLYNEGWIGVLQARKRFDPTKGIKFQTYAYAYAYGYIRKFLKREFKQKKGKKGAFRKDWDVTLENIETPEISMTNQGIDCQDILNKNFPDHITKSVMTDYFINNKNYREIGHNHDISHEWARKIVERSCNKLKERYSENENNTAD